MEGKKDIEAAMSFLKTRPMWGTTAVLPMGWGVGLQAECCNDANKYNGIIETFVINAFSGQNPTNS